MAKLKDKYEGHCRWYDAVWPKWQVAIMGSKPTGDLLRVAHALGCNPGKQAMAIAMMLRPGDKRGVGAGATRNQVLMMSGAFDGHPTGQFNQPTKMVQLGTFSRESAAGAYHLKLTPAGAALVTKHDGRPLRATPSLNAASGFAAVNTPAPNKPAKAPTVTADEVKPAKATKVKAATAKPTSKPRKPKVNVVPAGEPLIADNDVREPVAGATTNEHAMPDTQA